MKDHPALQELIGYADFTLGEKRRQKIHMHVVMCGQCQNQLKNIDLVHPTFRQLVAFTQESIKNHRIRGRVKAHLFIKDCAVCNRWIRKIRRNAVGDIELGRKAFEFEVGILSALPSASDLVVRRFITREFASQMDVYVEWQQTGRELTVNFRGSSEWSGSVMEFMFYDYEGKKVVLNGFFPFEMIDRCCCHTAHIPLQAFMKLKEIEFIINLYPIEVGELSGRDAKNLIWSVLVSDRSAFVSWFDLCKKIRNEGNDDLKSCADKIHDILVG